MIEHETLWSLLKDPAHWGFEIILIFIFDFLIGVWLWPKIKKFRRHHKSDDNKLDDLEKRIKALEDERSEHNVFYR
jgi:hypothetical protein